MKTIEIKHHRRELSKVGYQVDVATDNPDRLKTRLEAFEVTLRDAVPLGEANHHRLTVSVSETSHVSADHRLDAAMGVLGSTVGAVEIARKRLDDRLDDRDLREVQFELDFEARYLEFDVESRFRRATGVSVLQLRYLDGGNHACSKCNSEHIENTSHVDRRRGGALVRCRSCGYVGSLERRPRARIHLKVRETPGVTAEERLDAPISVIRSTARHFMLLDLKRIGDDGQQGEGVSRPSPGPIPGDVEANALAEVE